MFLLLSGYVFDFGGQTLFAFGGARSHDISGGILNHEDFASDRDFRRVYREWCHSGRLFRVKDYECWERECAPTEEEIHRGWEALSRNGNRVDLVLTHCLPTSAASLIGMGSPSDPVMDYLEEAKNRISFGNWICGHYHCNQTVDKRFHILYEQIVEVRKSQ